MKNAFIVWGLLLLAGCGQNSNSPVAPSDLPPLVLQNLVSAMTTGSIPAASRGGQAPGPNGGPTATVSGNQTVINGGTLTATVFSPSPFQTVYMYVGSKTVGLASEQDGGIDGYYELALPAAQTNATVLLEFPQTIPLHELELLFAVADPSGAVGPPARLATTIASVGTGDVQVTLSWDVDSDVDIHVVDPAGEEIYYGHRRSASGGELDLDSNAGCEIDGVRNENITWPVGRAPQGQYTVRVDYWDACGVQQSNYTVRINSGGNTQTFTGSFVGPGDQGGSGSGRLITTFQRSTGPTAQAASAHDVRNDDAAPASSKTAAAPQR
jgi:hypothetical protein